MKKIVYISLFFLLNFNGFSQQTFNVDFDYARFFYNDSLGYIEIYYSFYQPQLNIIKKDEALTVNGLLNVDITNKLSGEVLISRDFKFSNIVVDTLSELYNKSLLGNLGLILPFGEYNCRLTGKDINDSTKIDSISFSLVMAELPENRFSISDIQLASSIKKSEDTESMFYKNTYEIIPNPGNIFGENLPVVYFYSEFYNLDNSSKNELLKVQHDLFNSRNEKIYDKTKYVPVENSSIVDVGAIKINNYPSGTYSLVVSLTDTLNNLAVYSTKKLFIYNPSVIDTTDEIFGVDSLLSTEFATMSEEELNNYFEMSKYIANSNEKDRWEQLSGENGKANFLYAFWKARDRVESTKVNEYQREYFSRVEKANDRYTNIQRKGWKTDRGRVLIMYGDPSEVERYPNQVDTKPYEIWRYDQVEGGVIFVFADLTGYNDYQLINSTKRGELYDPNWQRRISTY